MMYCQGTRRPSPQAQGYHCGQPLKKCGNEHVGCERQDCSNNSFDMYGKCKLCGNTRKQNA